MAQIYKFFNSAPGDPRTYQAADFADYFGSVLSTGLIHTDNSPGMETFVESGLLRTYVSPGKAILQGHMYENTADEYLTHSLPESTTDRIDRIVLRLDLRNSERNILLHIKEGDPSANPVAPDLQRDNYIYELSLAQIRVRANTSSLEASDLIDERLNEDLCGLVNSMLTVPTSQFLSEWETFMDDLKNDGFIPTPVFNEHLAESTSERVVVSGADLSSMITTKFSLTVGKIPKSIRFYGRSQSSLKSSISFGDWVEVGQQQGGLVVFNDGLSTITNNYHILLGESGNYYRAVVSNVTTQEITMLWSKVGNPSPTDSFYLHAIVNYHG